MRVYHELGEVSAEARALALGIFDGVHIGHQAVIADARAWAERNDALSTAVTFDPHPYEVLNPAMAPKMIMSLKMKVEAISGLGCDELVVIKFDRELSQMRPADFCRSILRDKLGATRVSIGANFHFGRGAEGDAEYLKARGEEVGFEVNVMQLILSSSEAVSSTRVRELLQAGDVAGAAVLMGHPFEMEGTVVRGDGRGRKIGFPTANIAPGERRLVPAHGVYAALTENGHPAAVNVGVRPTFGSSSNPVVEAYLLDKDVDLYGRRLRLTFIKRLRDELRFESAQSLIDQMHRDIETVRSIVRTHQSA